MSAFNHNHRAGRVAQAVRALSRHTKVAGLIPRRGTCRNQRMNARVSGTHPDVSLFLSISPSLSNQSIKKNKHDNTLPLLYGPVGDSPCLDGSVEGPRHRGEWRFSVSLSPSFHFPPISHALEFCFFAEMAAYNLCDIM